MNGKKTRQWVVAAGLVLGLAHGAAAAALASTNAGGVLRHGRQPVSQRCATVVGQRFD